MKILLQIGIREFFDCIVASEDTNRHKHPDPFLEAARRLGVAPEGCLVWEDSDLGIERLVKLG